MNSGIHTNTKSLQNTSVALARSILRLASLTILGATPLLGLVLTGCHPQATPNLSSASELRKTTGAKTRLVWVQDVEDRGDFTNRYGGPTLLLGLDTDDSAGERLIIPFVGSYTKPLITPRGDRIVFTEYRRGLPRLGKWDPGDRVMYSRTRRVETRVVNWDGSGLRTVGPGRALEVWADPTTGREWVYIQAGPHRRDEPERNSIFRYPLDGFGEPEAIWSKTPVSAMGLGSFQLSADGRRAAGLFPWPTAGVLNLENETLTYLADGCWTGMAPDNSYRTWVFDGAHRNLLLISADGRITSKVRLNTAEELVGAEVYHPRWSNHPQFLAMTGPYRSEQGRGIDGAAEVEIWVGRFDDTRSTVESWVRATSNDRGDYFPDLWIERDPALGSFAAHRPVIGDDSAEVVVWPGDTGGLVFLWEDGSKNNEVLNFEDRQPRRSRLTLRGLAHFGRYNVMRLAGSSAFISDGAESDMLAAFKAGNQLTIEATLTAAGTTAQAAPIISLLSPEGTPFFSLKQQGNHLAFVLQTVHAGEIEERQLSLGSITPGTAHHIAITFAAYGRLSGYVDGRKVEETITTAGTFDHWSEARLIFGQTRSDSEPWSGELDGIALYSVELRDNRIAAHAALNVERLADRKPAERTEIRATLREITPIPPPASIAPYRRCLVVYRYDVSEVLSGKAVEARLLVAHWGILDGQRLFEDAPPIGSIHHLKIESFDDHAELLSERMDMASSEFDLPLFYAPMPPVGDLPTEAGW